MLKALGPNYPKLVFRAQTPNVTALGSKLVSCQAPWNFAAIILIMVEKYGRQSRKWKERMKLHTLNCEGRKIENSKEKSNLQNEKEQIWR